MHGGEHAVWTVTIEREREIGNDGRSARTTITIGDLGPTFVERVGLLEPSLLSALCTSARVAVDSVVGDDEPVLRDDSPVSIVFARPR